MSVTYVDPRGQVIDLEEPYKLELDLTVGSPTIALLANGFPDSERFLEEVEAALGELLPEARWRRYRKEAVWTPASAALLEEMAEECVAVVTAYGH